VLAFGSPWERGLRVGGVGRDARQLRLPALRGCAVVQGLECGGVRATKVLDHDEYGERAAYMRMGQRPRGVSEAGGGDTDMAAGDQDEYDRNSSEMPRGNRTQMTPALAQAAPIEPHATEMSTVPAMKDECAKCTDATPARRPRLIRLLSITSADEY
jgi:hypothetical protein